MIIKTVVAKSEETENQADSEAPNMVKQVESTQESKYYIQTNESCNPVRDQCSENAANSSDPDQKSGLDNLKDCKTEGTNWTDDVIEDIIKAEILHNLRTKLTGFPVDSYACKNCGEIFLSKSGCNQHLNRKSVHIIHKCPICESSIEFFNRCEFLLHIKNHGTIPSHEYLKKTTEFNVIAESKYLNFEYGERDENEQYYNEAFQNLKSISDSEDLPTLFKPGIVSTLVDNNCLNALDHEEEGNVTPLNQSLSPICTPRLLNDCSDEDQLLSNSSYGEEKSDFWCSSCRNCYSSPEIFFEHLKENEMRGAAAKTLYRCDLDDIPSYSHCKFVLHNRVIHKRCGPFLCPECGECFDCWETLYEHAKCECCHLSQSVFYTCVIQNCGQSDGAKELFAKSTDLLKHFEEEHYRYVLQCIYCTRAFATPDWLFKHLQTDKHSVALSESSIKQLSRVLEVNASERLEDIENLIQNYSKKLIQCLICNIVFCTDSSYNQHFSAKFSDHSEMKIVFTCATCSQPFCKRTVFKEHLLESTLCNNKCNEQSDYSEKASDECSNSETLNSLSSNTNKVNNSPKEKGCKMSSRTYRPRPKPLRIQPARAAASTTVPNIPNPNYVLSSTAVSLKSPSSSILRSHITQKCHYCQKNFDLSVIKRHETTCSKMQLDPGYCLACKQNHQGSLLLWYHGKNHLKSGLKICLFCNNREVFSNGQVSKDCDDSKDALEDHLYRFHVSHAKLPYKCMLCKDTITDKDGVYDHLKKHHNLSTIDSFKVKRSRSFQISQQPRTNVKGNLPTQSLLKMKRENNATVDQDSSDAKIWKKSKTGDIPSEKSLNSSDLMLDMDDGITVMEVGFPEHLTKIEQSFNDSKAIPFVPLNVNTQNAREKEGMFTCFKCTDYFAKTEDEFCDHIRMVHILSDQEEMRHYNGGIGVFPVEFRDFWCPECDISFVVKPTLVKHLQFSHTYIENVDDYMKKVGYDSKRPLKEHQCEICYLRCSDSTEQYNHMKSHGMAFLRLRQQRKASD